ncbi:MAG: hypothetical protein ACI9XO_003586 [Paraglaciecola sp.]|jgi:hypothetical protein
MKLVKRILLVLLVLIVLFVGVLVVIPYFFKDEILATVKTEINKSVNATVDFADVDISLLRSFPDLSLKLENYEVIGVGEFEGVKLMGGESFGLTMDVMSAINSDTQPLEIKSINLEKPEIHVIVLPNGNANYDIAKATAEKEATENLEMQIDLQAYSINEGVIIYDDQRGDIYLEINGLDHEGEGDFTLEVFDLATTTDIAEMTVKSGGISYLKKAKLNYVAGFNIDMPNSKYTLKENELTVNELKLKTDGWVAIPKDDIDMDLTFDAPQNSFKNLLSLIPNAFIADYSDVKANGKFVLDGFVKGTYSTRPERYPTFNIKLNIDDADVKYPDLPLGISDIMANIEVNSPTTSLNGMTIDIAKFNLKVGKNPFGGYFKLKTPMTDPDIDTKVSGVIDLAEMNRAFPMEGVKKMDGKITSNIMAKTKMSTIENEDYGNVQMAGDMKVEYVNYEAEGMPFISVKNMDAIFSPKAVTISDFDAKLGKSDLRADGQLDNILAYFSSEKTMKGKFKIWSDYFNADEWMPAETAAPATVPTPEVTTSEEAIFDRFDFDIDAEIKQLDYDVYELKNIVAGGNFTSKKLTVSNFGMDIGNSDIEGSGYLDNVFPYVFENKTLEGQLDLKSKFFDLNQFMTEEETATTAAAAPPATTEEMEPILVPDNLALAINADFDKIRYTNLDLDNVKGSMMVANEAVEITKMTANSLGGKMNVTGGYDTKNQDKPKFDFNYDLQQLDFQESFAKLNTFAAIAPIGKFIDGNFSSKLKMSSELGKDFMPDLNTLLADGFLSTFNAKIKNFPPIEALADKLNIKELKNLDVKGTKNWFVVKDGAVAIEPFEYVTNNIAMNIAGSHQLTGGMDYNIDAKIPRELIGNNAAGAAANQGLELLAGQAGKLGINLDAGEFVNVRINVTGSMTDPKIKLNLLGASGESKSVKDAVVDSVKDKTQEAFDQKKAEAEARLEKERKLAEERVRAEVDKLKDKAKVEAEKKAKELKDKLKKEAQKRAADEAAKILKDKLDQEAKDKLKELNPFKKKGGGGE